jgi:hypothetical protein
MDELVSPGSGGFKRPRSPLERMTDASTVLDDDENWRRSKRYLAQVSCLPAGPAPQHQQRSRAMSSMHAGPISLFHSQTAPAVHTSAATWRSSSAVGLLIQLHLLPKPLPPPAHPCQVMSQGLSKLTFVNTGAAPGERSPGAMGTLSCSRAWATPSPDAANERDLMPIDAPSPITLSPRPSPRDAPHSLGRRILSSKRRSATNIPCNGDLSSPTSPTGGRGLAPTACSSLRLELQLSAPSDIAAAPTDLRKVTLLKALLVKADEELRSPPSAGGALASPGAGGGGGTTSSSSWGGGGLFAAATARAAATAAAASSSSVQQQRQQQQHRPPHLLVSTGPPAASAAAEAGAGNLARAGSGEGMDICSDLLSPSEGGVMSEGPSYSMTSGPSACSTPTPSTHGLPGPFSPLPLPTMLGLALVGGSAGGSRPESAAAAAAATPPLLSVLGQQMVRTHIGQDGSSPQQQQQQQQQVPLGLAALLPYQQQPGARPPLPPRGLPGWELSKERLERLRAKALLGASQLAAEAREEAAFRPRRLHTSRSSGGAVEAALQHAAAAAAARAAAAAGGGGAVAPDGGDPCASPSAGLPPSPRRHSSHL